MRFSAKLLAPKLNLRSRRRPPGGRSSPKRVSKATFQFPVECLPPVLGFPPDGCPVVTLKLDSVDREERADSGSQKQRMSHEAACYNYDKIDCRNLATIGASVGYCE
jgi:hypothetical protein